MFFVVNFLHIGSTIAKRVPEDARCCVAPICVGFASLRPFLSELHPNNRYFRPQPPFRRKPPLVATRHVHTRFGIPSVANTQDFILSTNLRQKITMGRRNSPLNLCVIFTIFHAQITFPVLSERDYANHFYHVPRANGAPQQILT